jgi:transcriptional regulator with XRE-family HTH domain
MEVSGEKIRVLREALGLTTEALATRVKPKPVTRQAVESWEKGGVKTFRMLKRVAEALGVRPESLLKKGD